MVGFTRLQVSGYRRLRNLDLALGPMNVLIGANGVGKSSVLEAWELLAAAAAGALQMALRNAGGAHSLLTADGQTREIRFLIESEERPQQPTRYEFSLNANALFSSLFNSERLSRRTGATEMVYLERTDDQIVYRNRERQRLEKVDWEYRRGETVLSQLPRLEYPIEDFREDLVSARGIYHALDVSPNGVVRKPQPIQPADTPGADGSLLYACLYTMRESQRERFEAVEDALRAAFPSFERLDLPPVAAGQVILAWKDRAFSGQIFANQLSEGTLRFLWLATLLQSPGLPPVTLIDEPEVSLHPEMLRLLVELMREASARTQLIVATHSDRLVRFLTQDELVICDLAEDGGMTATRGDTLDLDEWLKDYTLDQLWSIGQIGGRS